jgi:5'-3' exonuclease
MHGEHGIDGMLPLMVGWLTQILAHEPAHLAIALDSPGETWRHRLRHPLDEAWRYKADRPPKPPEFTSIAKTATRIAELHAIPMLWADGYEADDLLATATARARDVGYRVWIATADKDLHHLVEDMEVPGRRERNLVVGTWTPFERDTWVWRGPQAVREAYGVDPAQIPDWLAISGDKSDGVPGIGQGIGGTRAAAILARYPTLAEALAAPVWSSTKVAEVEADIKRLAKEIKKGGDAAIPLVVEREALMEAKRVEGWRLTLKAHEQLALFSRELTALDCDAPIDMPWEELPVGGFEVEELRALYTRHGFTKKAAEVPAFRKRAPWRLPWAAEERPRPQKGARSDAGSVEELRGADGSGGGRALAAHDRRAARDARSGQRSGGDTVRGAGERHEGAAGGGGEVLRGQLPEVAAPIVAPHACSFSGCVGAPLHDRARAIVAGIETAEGAIDALFKIRALGMPALFAEEHCAHAGRRHAELEGRAA